MNSGCLVYFDKTYKFLKKKQKTIYIGYYVGGSGIYPIFGYFFPVILFTKPSTIQLSNPNTNQ